MVPAQLEDQTGTVNWSHVAPEPQFDSSESKPNCLLVLLLVVLLLVLRADQELVLLWSRSAWWWLHGSPQSPEQLSATR